MESKEENNESLKASRDRYDAAFLKFLNQEITTSSGSAEDRKGQAEDVDTLVEDLLKESMSVSEPAQADEDTGVEDLDLLFARIFNEQKPASPADAAHPRSVVDSRASEILKEISLADGQTAEIRVIEKPSRQEAALAVAAETPAHVPAIPLAVEAASKPLQPVLKADKVREVEKPEPALLHLEELRRSVVFAPPRRSQTWSLRIALIAAASVCLLAGAGVVLFKSSTNRMPAKSDQPSVSTAQTPDPEAVQPAMAQPEPAPATETKPAVARPVRNVNNPTPGAAFNSGALPKGGTPEPQPVPPPAANAAMRTVPVDTAAKTAPPITPPADKPVANPPQRAAEVTPPAPAPKTPSAPESSVASLIPRASTILEDPGAVKRPAFQPPAPPPALPKKATPPVVISRVLPVYPELARRSRIVGTVVVDVMINEKGGVTKATAVSGPPVLQVEAVNAVMRWQFRPAYLDGTPVPSTTQVSIVFK